jgi:hypothetical protein
MRRGLSARRSTVAQVRQRQELVMGPLLARYQAALAGAAAS